MKPTDSSKWCRHYTRMNDLRCKAVADAKETVDQVRETRRQHAQAEYEAFLPLGKGEVKK